MLKLQLIFSSIILRFKYPINTVEDLFSNASPWQITIPRQCVCNYRNAWTVKEYCSLFIDTRHSLWRITIMSLIKVYNNDSNTCGLKGHSTFKSVYNSEASWTTTFGHHMPTAPAEVVSSCRTFGDEAWSQQIHN
jgi:hypothetical protein